MPLVTPLLSQAGSSQPLDSAPGVDIQPCQTGKGRKVNRYETISGFSLVRGIKNCVHGGVDGTIMQLACLFSRHPRISRAMTYIPSVVSDELASLDKLTSAFSRLNSSLIQWVPAIELIERSLPGVMLKTTLSASRAIYCNTLGWLPWGMNYISSGCDRVTAAIQTLSDHSVDDVPILDALKTALKVRIKCYTRYRQEEIKQLCKEIVEKEMNYIQELLETQDKRARKSTLLQVLKEKYRYSRQTPDSRAGQMYGQIIKKMSHDMYTCQSGYMLAMVGWSVFNAMDKEDQVRYRTDISRFTSTVNKKVLAELKELGLPEPKIVMALILYAIRDKAFDSMAQMYRDAVMEACKVEMEDQIHQAFASQIDDMYKKNLPRKTRVTSEEMQDYRTTPKMVDKSGELSKSELSNLFAHIDSRTASCPQAEYRTRALESKEKVKTRGEPGAPNPVQVAGPLHKNNDQVYVLSGDEETYWHYFFLQNKIQKGSKRDNNLKSCLSELTSTYTWDSGELQKKKMAMQLRVGQSMHPVYHLSSGTRGDVNGTVTLLFARVNNNFEPIALARHAGTTKGDSRYQCDWKNDAYKVPNNFTRVLKQDIVEAH